MPRRKLARIAGAHQIPCIIQNPEEWERPAPDRCLILELGTGKGDFILGVAQQRPECLCIGLDFRNARLYYGGQAATELGLGNLLFMRGRVEQLDRYFHPQSIDEIWLTFPDPFPKRRDEKNRMTSPQFIERYRTLLKPGGRLSLKTDNYGLYSYTLESLRRNHPYAEIVEHTPDLYASDLVNPINSVQTAYERRFRAAGMAICYMSCRIR